MARRYVRDNRGRFAPKGSGATARGGRLKTASGKKRETQTIKASSGGVAGTIGKPKGLKPNTIKPKPQVSNTPRRTRKPTAAESRAKGLKPISEIQARQAAQAKASQAANAGNYQRRFQSDRTKAAAAQYRASGSKGQKYSTIKNPAPEGSAPFAVTGSTYQGRKNAAAGRAARDASKSQQNRRSKTDMQRMQQADRIMEKLAKRQKAVVNNASSLESGLKGIRRNNARAGRVNRALEAKGLLGEYNRRTASADPIRMTPAGKGIPKPKPAAKRADRAASNIPMSGARGRKLDAEISRNVKQQAVAKQAESKARNRQFKSDQSRAKALRNKYGDQLARDFAAKSGKKVSEVKATIKGMAPSQQVKLLTKAGREQRAQANLARTADTRNQPGSKMIRRPSQKTIKSNLKAEKALEFYKDPKKALKSVNKKRAGFRLPKGMR